MARASVVVSAISQSVADEILTFFLSVRHYLPKVYLGSQRNAGCGHIATNGSTRRRPEVMETHSVVDGIERIITVGSSFS